MVWRDPLTAFGLLSAPLLFDNLLSIIGFMLAAWFCLHYTLKFYEGRPKPPSWLLIVAGLLVTGVSEIGQAFLLYQVSPGMIEPLIILLANIASGIAIVTGCYFLFKEVA
jgi:hypothetical protein